MLQRVTPAPGEAPYYFTWTLVLDGGERVSQYDERGRLWQIGHPDVPKPELESLLRKVTRIEIYPHPTFGPNAPLVRLALTWPWKLEYEGRKSVSVGGREERRYYKQGLTVVSGDGTRLRALPADLESAGKIPNESYEFQIDRVVPLTTGGEEG